MPCSQGHGAMVWGFSGSQLEMKVSGNSDQCYWVCSQVCFQVQAASLTASPQWAQLLLWGQLLHGHSRSTQERAAAALDHAAGASRANGQTPPPK